MLLAGAHLVTERLGENKPEGSTLKKKKKKEPFWKRRIEEKIRQTRKDISQLVELKKGVTLKESLLSDLKCRHPLLRKKGLTCIIEELKQRLRAKAAKIKRFNKRCQRYQENNLFSTNQRQFYRNMEKTTVWSR